LISCLCGRREIGEGIRREKRTEGRGGEIIGHGGLVTDKIRKENKRKKERKKKRKKK
jgi:hypothetical protein